MKKTYATMLAMLLLVFASNASYAQTCPPFPARGYQIISQFLDVPANLALAKSSNDDDRRLLTLHIAQQMKFELGNWSVKSADPGRPQSKDSLALPMRGVEFCNYDWQNGSTRRAYDVINGVYLVDQNLIATAAVNHLGSVVVEPPGPVVTPVPSVSNDPAFVELKQQLASLNAELRQIQESFAAQVAAFGAQGERIASVEGSVARIDAFLASKPIPVSCRASLFGLGVSCRLE